MYNKQLPSQSSSQHSSHASADAIHHAQTDQHVQTDKETQVIETLSSAVVTRHIQPTRIWRRRWMQSAVLTALIVILAGCSSGQAAGEPEDGILHITATTGMIADAAREIGGEHVEVVGLMGPGVDPHMYKASQGDIRKLDDADLVLYNGLHLEGSMTDILEKMSDTRQVVAITDQIEPERLRQSEENATEHDPHIWFDVSLWMSAVERARDAMVAADPAHADAYRSNADTYLKELEQLHTDVQQQIANIPQQSRVLVTAHDAFGYYGDAYDIEVRGLQGISTASEYGSKDVVELRNMLVERGIKAVFVESSIPARSMEAIIAGAAEQGHQVSIGGELYSDALGAADSEAGTYVGMVKHNTATIVNALK